MSRQGTRLDAKKVVRTILYVARFIYNYMVFNLKIIFKSNF